MILLDTSVLVAAYRRKPPQAAIRRPRSALRRMIGAGMALGIPAIVLQEVLAGVRDKAQFYELHSPSDRVSHCAGDDRGPCPSGATRGRVCSAKRIRCPTAMATIVAQAAQDQWMFTL